MRVHLALQQHMPAVPKPTCQLSTAGHNRRLLGRRQAGQRHPATAQQGACTRLLADLAAAVLLLLPLSCLLLLLLALPPALPRVLPLLPLRLLRLILPLHHLRQAGGVWHAAQQGGHIVGSRLCAAPGCIRVGVRV